MKKRILLFLALSCLFSLVHAQHALNPFALSMEENMEISINNRILAKVNGKPISVIDVMKKMDMIFYKEFPEYASSKAARYQFYVVNWKSILQELVNLELVLADAEESKLEVSNGDIRQEMEQLFGPNIISNLDKIDMSMEEAWKIVKSDIILRRMMMHRVNSKALRQVGPLAIKEAYETYTKEHVKSDEWHYHVISIRDKNAERGAALAEKVSQIIAENQGASFDQVAEKIKQLPVEKGTMANVSEEQVHNEVQLSPAYKEALNELKPGTFSNAIAQKSRSDKSMVYRFFYVKERIEGSVLSFQELEFDLKEKLLQEEMAKESDLYMKKLRHHFAVNDNLLKEMIPDNFEPFAIR